MNCPFGVLAISLDTLGVLGFTGSRIVNVEPFPAEGHTDMFIAHKTLAVAFRLFIQGRLAAGKPSPP